VEIPVIVKPLVGNRYRATGAGGLSLGLTAEGQPSRRPLTDWLNRFVLAKTPERSWLS
jgi:hypothetical protein